MSNQVPQPLLNTFRQWKNSGEAAPSPSPWKRERWERAGVNVPNALSDAPIDREEATRWAARLTADDRQAQRDAFVVAMIWGYGPVPYGPFRTHRIMARPEFADELAEVTRVAIEHGGVAAYRLVHQRRSEKPGAAGIFLKWLGPAFGTKYIYFITRANQHGQVTPVLDEVVRRWFAINASAANVHIGYQWEHPDRYGNFVDTVHEWGRELGIAADDVEYLIFAQQQASDGGQWQEGWLSSEVTMDPSQLLEQLGHYFEGAGHGDQAADALGQLQDLLEAAR